ncbi:MAG: OmpH family outer membrane protein [Desulfobacterales bacterium]|nr:OmpH family outer membrane protein [Desulfobacterales bacterium]
MKKVLACFVLVGLLVATPLAYAESIKIGYFDLERVLGESKRWAKERDAFVKRGTELRKAFDKKKAELDAIKESLDKRAGMLNEQAMKEKEREYQRKAKELDRLGQDADAELKQINTESAGRLNKSLMIIINKLGQDNKYTVILEKATVPYAAKELDITNQVIKAFDAARE